MKKIKTIQVQMSGKEIPVSIFKLESSVLPDNISRVYAIGANKEGMVPLIFNSKRNIWGFPGGHTEEGETPDESIRREVAEETGYNISNCEARFCISSKLDEEQEQNQIIYFCLIEDQSATDRDDNETVTDVKLQPIDNILREIGNNELWEEIVSDFKNWFSLK